MKLLHLAVVVVAEGHEAAGAELAELRKLKLAPSRFVRVNK